MKERKGGVLGFHGFRESLDRADREALWSVLQIYGIGGRLMRAVKSFFFTRTVRHVLRLEEVTVMV